MIAPQAPIEADELPEFVTKTPNRTYTNASAKQAYKPAPWQSMRDGADDGLLIRSKGF